MLVLLSALAFSTTHHHESSARQVRDAGSLENGLSTLQMESELSMVQIEQMRVISPDAAQADELSRREEQLKYALLGHESGVRPRLRLDCPPSRTPVSDSSSASGMPQS